MAIRDFSTSLNVTNKVYWGTAAPTDTDKRYEVGDIVISDTPAAGGAGFWFCSVAGTPGTWLTVPVGTADTVDLNSGTIATFSSTVGTIATASVPALTFGRPVQTLAAAAQVIPNGYGLTLITLSAGANTFTLSPAASHAAGFETCIKNLANNSVTLVTAAGAEYDAAAITLAQNAKVVLVGNGVQWFAKA
jgi:hypothetical protein